MLNTRKTTEYGLASALLYSFVSRVSASCCMVAFKVQSRLHPSMSSWCQSPSALTLETAFVCLSLLAVFTIFALALSCLQLLPLPEFEEVWLPSHSNALAQMHSSRCSLLPHAVLRNFLNLFHLCETKLSSNKFLHQRENLQMEKAHEVASLFSNLAFHITSLLLISIQS